MKITLISKSASTKRSDSNSKESQLALKQYNAIVKNMLGIEARLEKMTTIKSDEAKTRKQTLNQALQKAKQEKDKLLDGLKSKGIPLPLKGRLTLTTGRKHAGSSGKKLTDETAKTTLETIFKGAKVVEKKGRMSVEVPGSKQKFDLIPLASGKYKVEFNANDADGNKGFTVVENPKQLSGYIQNKLDGF